MRVTARARQNGSSSFGDDFLQQWKVIQRLLKSIVGIWAGLFEDFSKNDEDQPGINNVALKFSVIFLVYSVNVFYVIVMM